MTNKDEAEKTIVIIGGGVSGALTAFHLHKRRTQGRVIVIDPRPELGLGLAYSTPSLRHLLNVPAGKMSALQQQPDHFLKWLRRNFDPAALPGISEQARISGVYRHNAWLPETYERLDPSAPITFIGTG